MRRLLSVLVAALVVVGASPALAANQTVSVGDNFFTPSKVGVIPGESVTWNRPAGGIAHNVTFDDGVFSPAAPNPGPWSATRSFATDGAYRFYCEVHGGPGGSGMSGIVYVNATGSLPPVAALSVLPSPAQVGQAVSFNGTGSTATDGSIVKYEWDLDGDGSFETDTGATATASRSYSAPQTLTAKLRVTDDRGATDEKTRLFRVNAAPSASFTASPNPIQAGQFVEFNGASSSDPDGFIVKYEWDLDGNGTFETDAGATSNTFRAYSSPGTVTVKLRVTDGTGASGETSRSLQVDPSPAPLAPLALTPLRPPLSPRRAEPKPGACSKLKGRRRVACIRRRCRTLKGARRRACVKRVTRRQRS